MTLLTHVAEPDTDRRHESTASPRSYRRPTEAEPHESPESPEVTFERLADRIESIQADLIRQHRVELARQRIDEGVYDDPRVVDVAVDRLMAALGAVHANA